MAGCTVQPLYSSGAGAGGTIGGSVTPDMRTKLASVAIDPAGDVFQQQVRNRLIFLLGGVPVNRPIRPIGLVSV